MQNGSSRSSKKFIKIPGEDIFIHTFKFNTNLPLPPIPYAKTLYYPLDSERYSKPKLTSFHLRSAAPLLTKCDLGIPVDEINMKSYLYNGEDLKGEAKLDEEDEMIINEKILKTDLDNNGENMEHKDEESIKTEEREDGEEEENANFLDEDIISPTKARIKIDENDLRKIIDKTFLDINSAKVGISHPRKPGVVCSKIYDITPHYKDVNIELICIGDENLKTKLSNERYVIKSVVDIDKQEIFKIYDRVQNKPSEEPNTHKEKEKEIMEKMEIEKEPNETNEEPKKPNEPKEENVQMEKKENNNEKERHLERNEKYEVDVLIFLRNKIFSRIKNKIKKEYEFKHIGNFLFTKTLTNEVKKDYLLSFNIQENNAFLYDLKAVFFIRKNKYTDEMKSGKQSCLKINVKNMNKGDLIDIKAKLAKLNFKTNEIQEKIDNYKEIEKIEDNSKGKNDSMGWGYGPESEEEEKKHDKDKMEIEENKPNSEVPSPVKSPFKKKPEDRETDMEMKDQKEIITKTNKKTEDSDEELFLAENVDEEDNEKKSEESQEKTMK